ncbi:hypothetical protein BVRB_7g171490 [Beta vulgaris subsp. vulgaris]|nr:hypothetical protein BVRB_7g171490 [Beta vulgaris subsp. vulgaris]
MLHQILGIGSHFIALRWFAGNLNRVSDDFDTPLRDDLDIIEHPFLSPRFLNLGWC